MQIAHLALWVSDLEKMKAFYMTYFQVSTGPLYVNAKKQFSSYFLSFGKSATQLEIMHAPNVINKVGIRGFDEGLAHFAISVGSKEKVNDLTEVLRADGYTIASEARTTGDGYFESVVLDPEGNYLELTT